MHGSLPEVVVLLLIASSLIELASCHDEVRKYAGPAARDIKRQLQAVDSETTTAMTDR